MKPERPQNLAADVQSEPVVYPSRNGLKVAAFWDHRREGFEGCPYVVMAPKFGETKKNNLQLAYMLAANGMNVIRFDHTCHVGESAGDKKTFTLASAVEDILGTFDFVQAQFGVASAALVASSLSARTAIRASAQDMRVNLLLCVVGVVNLQFTLREVYREDLVGLHLSGRRWGVGDMLGVEMDYDGFLASAVSSRMHDLAGTMADLGTVKAPIIFFSGEDDVWVNFDDVVAAAAQAPAAKLVRLAGAKHEVRENHAVAEQAFHDIVSTILCHAWGLERPPEALRAADRRSLLTQNRIERERLRNVSTSAETETQFWSEYLHKYELLDRVDDFRTYVDLLVDLLGPIQPGELVLDAGCGIGLFGAWLMRRLQTPPATAMPAVYVGLDLTDSGLGEACARHAGLAAMRLRDAAAGKGIYTAYARADFDQLDDAGVVGAGMPRFGGATFDAICCSLVLSYLQRPVTVLREFRRLLRPGGRIVVSSMKPHCDMSVLYRDFMDQQISDTELDSGRRLLTAASRIRLKEEQGQYVFFAGDELAGLMREAGFRDAQVFTSFGDQAVVVRAAA